MISGKVLKSEIDGNGNIKVETEYTLTDGSKKIGHTRYNYVNFNIAKIEKDVKTHCETLMKMTWALKEHQALMDSTDISNIKHDCTQAEVVIESAVTDKDGVIVTPAVTRIIDDN